MTNKIFALDIGTRKVMGLLIQIQDDGVRILDMESREHPTRSMSAGQIQDIPKVIQVVAQVTQALADRTGEPLKRVAVAVAGRNLKTILGRASIHCPKDRTLEPQDIQKVTYDALEDALMRLNLADEGEAAKPHYYCVGYVVSRYLLDGEAASRPCGHRGERLEAEILASFLPWQVLESQLAVLEAAGLETSSVTLEPIAALQAVVDSDLKQFDMALVDVGAGTSDIAIVSGGVIRSFGMVPCAGDSITERLAGHFLLEFATAEHAKRTILSSGTLEATSVLQQRLSLSSAEVLAAIAPAVSELAQSIARCILELRGGQPPQMILCVGGGSLTPGLFQELANAMGMPAHRVGTRSPGLTLGLKDAQGQALGPEIATPLGIACVAAAKGGVRFQTIFMNGQRFLLLQMGRPLTVLSALMAAGVSAKKIFGWPGRSKTYTVNGEFRVFKAGETQPTRLSVNGEPAKIEDPIRDGDKVDFVAGGMVDQAAGTVGDALKLKPIALSVNGHSRQIWPVVTCAGRSVAPSEPLADRMALTMIPVTVGQILTEEEKRKGHVHCNGHRVSMDVRVRDGDKIETLEHNVAEEVLQGPVEASQLQKDSLRVCLNGTWITLKDRDGRPILPGRDACPLLVDVLRHLPLPAGGVPGKRLKLLLDGQEAKFTSPLQQGAEVRIFFE